MTFEAFVEAVYMVFSWPTIFLLILGILLGIFFGAIPGIGAALGMAVLLPFTLPLAGIDAIIFLTGIYCASCYSASIPAILMNIPGSANSAAATLDGYPMSREGKALDAISVSIVASVIGGLLAFSFLLLTIPLFRRVILAFGSPEYFMVTIIGVGLISIVSQGAMVKGIFAGAMGFLVATVGIAPGGLELRYTYGNIHLYDGFDFVAIIIGIFAVAEMIKLSAEQGGIAKKDPKVEGDLWRGFEILKYRMMIIKSTAIGIFIGMIPGAGGVISNFLAYAEAMRSSKEPALFGSGSIEGLAAADVANNATVGGALVPTIAFGIPGNGSTAILLGGFILHGIDPGSALFGTDIHLTYALFFSLIIGSIVIFIAGYAFITKSYLVTVVDTHILIPIILVVAIVGGFSLRANWVDVLSIFVIGLLGFFMKIYGYSIIAFILGVILGPITEANMYRVLGLSEGNLIQYFAGRPISIILILLFIFIFSTSMKR